MKRNTVFFLLLAALAFPLIVAGQTLNIEAWPNGYISLNDGWRTRAGDNPAYAQPGFDDSAWSRVSLEHQNANPFGWQWYRLRVQLPQQHPPLALLIEGCDGTYEVYIDGRRVPGPSFLPPLLITYPKERVVALNGTANEIEIALRTFVPESSLFQPDRDGMRIRLGTASAIQIAAMAAQSERLRGAVSTAIINFLIILCGIGILGLYSTQRGHKEYLWLGCYLVLMGLGNGAFLLSHAGLFPVSGNWFFAEPQLYLYTIIQIEFTFSFAGQRIGKGWRLYQALLIAYPLLLLYPVWRNALALGTYNFIEALLITGTAILLPVLLLIWYLRGNREAGWLILPSLLPNATIALWDLGLVFAFFGWMGSSFLMNTVTFGPIPISSFDLADLMFLLAIGIVMFFRFTRISREQARAAAELEAARSMQSLLIPAEPPATPGFTVETVYLPASEVGGDFFQVLPADDGSLLIVVGDVSGKGLKAAMTVSAIIGALRGCATRKPAEVLAYLNRILNGQITGFATCTAALIAVDGAMTLANAGNLAPYRNGEELAIDSGLPLGITSDVNYEETRYQLNPNDRLTFISDGVVEAANEHRELFGFDRTQAISTQSAGAITETAKQFGQQDDITVLTLQFVPAEVLHA
jgi:hypothetical protein